MLVRTLGLVALLSTPALAETPAAAPAAPAPASASVGPVHRGGAFTLKDQVTLDDVAGKADTFAGKTIKVTGKVASVCQKKGCWMTLNGGTAAAVARVTFKDYGFFAPLDCQGRSATVEGTIEVKKLDDKERAHLAEDAGKKIDEIPANELRIVATALEIAGQ